MQNRFKEQGSVSESLGILFVIALIIGFFWLISCIRWNTSDQIVSGIVYSTSNDNWPSGNTTFSVRADVNTYVNSSNESSFCLPPNSPYKSIINKAAADKKIKVIVTTKKFFTIKSNPLQCVSNVTVAEDK